jgi:hypothetical protein
VTVALLNMVFGIMIDTFSELREAQQERKDTLTNTCFMCREHRSEFGEGGKRPVRFSEHIKQEHNISDYILFIAHLYEKEETEHNGLETYVFKLVEQEFTSWLPHKAFLAEAEEGVSDSGGGGGGGGGEAEQAVAVGTHDAAIAQLGVRMDQMMEMLNQIASPK